MVMKDIMAMMGTEAKVAAVQQPHYAEPDYSWIPPTSQQD
jgi:hypothetical protein